MVKLHPFVEANTRVLRTNSMFYDPCVVASGTDKDGRRCNVRVDGHKRFMVANTTYEDEEATRAIYNWVSTNACLEAFLAQKVLWCQERNYLIVVCEDGYTQRLRTGDILEEVLLLNEG